MKPDLNDLHDEFTYNDGRLYRTSGGACGYKRPDGYVVTRFNGKTFYEHRLIYFMLTGEWPNQVDHINGNRSDNRITNLRNSTHAQNCMNRKNTKAKAKGCYWIEKRQKWMVQVGHREERRTIGYFKSLEEASLAYFNAAKELYGEFATT